MSIVAKIAKPGKSVYSASPKDFSLDTDFQAMIRAVDLGGGTVAIDGTLGSTTTVTIPHSLGYTPFFLVFIKWDSALPPADASWTSGNGYSAEPDSTGIEYIPKVDGTNLVLRWINTAGMGGGAYMVSYQYLIGRDPL